MAQPTSDDARFKVPRGVLLGLSFVFIAGTSSAIWSWQRLKPILLHQEAFQWLCEDDNTPVISAGDVTAKCLAQENALTSAWRFGCASPMIVSFFIGVLFDWLGSRWTGVCGQALFLSGFLSFSIAAKWPNGWLYYFGFFCIGVAQVPVFTACVSLSKLFPKSPNFIITMLSSAGDLSYNVPLVLSGMRLLYLRNSTDASQSSASAAAFFWYSIIFCSSQIIVAVLFFPGTQFETPKSLLPLLVPEDHEVLPVVPEERVLWRQSLFKQICSWLFAVQLFYFTVSFLRQSFLNGAVDSILGNMGSDDNKQTQSRYILELFKWIQGVGFVFSLSFGAFADWSSLSIALFVHNSFALVSSLSLAVFRVMWIQPIGFIAFQFFTSFLFSQAFCWVNQVFGLKRVNTLMAFITAPSGFLQLLANGLISSSKVSQEVLNHWINIAFLSVTPFLYVAPSLLFFHERRQKQSELLSAEL